MITSRPTCAVALPTSVKAMKFQTSFYELHLDMSKLFAPFRHTSIFLPKDDEIKNYVTIRWKNPIVKLKNNHYHVYCLHKLTFKLIKILSKDKQSKWINCPTSLESFNFLSPGWVSNI